MSRPRNPEVERRILEITLRHLSEHGYSRMSVDGIAAEAGAGKPTIYRRWTSKADLAIAAVNSLRLTEPIVDTGSVKGDLTGVLQNFRRNLLRPNGMALVGTVLAEEAHTPELLELFRERLVRPRRAQLAAILTNAKRGGELRRGVKIPLIVNMLVGGIYAHYLASPDIPESYPAALVAAIWKGIAATGKATGRSRSGSGAS